MKLSTDGERLFALIQNEILESIGNQYIRWSTIGILFDSVGQTNNFVSYMRGAVTVHSVRRLLRYWAEERQNILDESTYVRKVRAFIKEEVFSGLSDDLTTKLARTVIEAERVSFKDISRQVRKNVLLENKTHHCYLCHCDLDPKALKDDPEYLTLEHLWPTSIGGNSIEENLLPACKNCQDDTKDTMSWEWLNVHNFVLPPSPSENALRSISRKEKVARHFQHAFDVCRKDDLSLKEAFWPSPSSTDTSARRILDFQIVLG